MTGGLDYRAAREAMAGIVLFGHPMGGVDKPAEDDTEPVPNPRPQRPSGSADQGPRGLARPDNPREMFARFLDGSLR